LFAHDVYLMPQKFRAAKGETILISAHTGDSFPMSEQAVDPGRLTTMPAAEWRMLGKATHATYTVESTGANVFGLSTKPRLLKLEPAKFIEYLKEEGLTAAIAAYPGKELSREMYSKYAKTIVTGGAGSEGFDQPLGLKVEFIPLTDPFGLKAGDEFSARLLFDGKPLADTQVELAMTKGTWMKARTGADGKVTFRVPNEGKFRLHAVHMVGVKESTHDWESFWASLTFEVSAAGQVSSR
jgi:hypothetical protein